MRKKKFGTIQTETKLENRRNIIKVLIDNKWHDYKEIKEQVKISNVTLSGHLSEMKALLDKRKDPSSKRLSAQYKLKPLYALTLARGLFTEIAWKEIEDRMLQTEDRKTSFKEVTESINAITDSHLLTVIESVAKNKDLREDEEIIYLFLETFVWESYKNLTWNFVQSIIKNYMKEEN